MQVLHQLLPMTTLVQNLRLAFPLIFIFRYRHTPDVPQRNDPSSVHRLARLKELPTPTNVTGILKVLGDTGDKQYPFYRTATPPDGAATFATGK